MIVYGNNFEWFVAMKLEDARRAQQRLVIGVFATRDAAKLFLHAACNDAPQYEFELLTLDDYERDYCNKIDGKPLGELKK